MKKGLNLHKIVSKALNVVNPMQEIVIKLYASQAKDEELNVIIQYNDYSTTARIQLQNNQPLQHRDSLSMTEITKRFYISLNSLTGLNRNIGTAGDYIVHGELYYKINEVVYDFNTGWVCVVGTETVGLND